MTAGGAFSLIYGATVLFRRRGGWRDTARALCVNAVAAAPVLAALAWCKWNLTFEGPGAAVAIGYAGPITRAPFVMPALALGPLLCAAAAGLLFGRSRAAASLAPALSGSAIGFILLYLVTMPGADIVWIGWRAGQIQHFCTDDGLPDSRVFSVAEDANGTLWAGTGMGLARLDGERFAALGLSHAVRRWRASACPPCRPPPR